MAQLPHNWENSWMGSFPFKPFQACTIFLICIILLCRVFGLLRSIQSWNFDFFRYHTDREIHELQPLLLLVEPISRSPTSEKSIWTLDPSSAYSLNVTFITSFSRKGNFPPWKIHLNLKLPLMLSHLFGPQCSIELTQVTCCKLETKTLLTLLMFILWACLVLKLLLISFYTAQWLLSYGISGLGSLARTGCAQRICNS